MFKEKCKLGVLINTTILSNNSAFSIWELLQVLQRAHIKIVAHAI